MIFLPIFAEKLKKTKAIRSLFASDSSSLCVINSDEGNMFYQQTIYPGAARARISYLVGSS